MTFKPRYAMIETTKLECQKICFGFPDIRLPRGVGVDAHEDCIDRDASLIRLSGPGLPEACEVEEGGVYERAAFEIRPGPVDFLGGGPIFGELVLLFATEKQATAVTNAGTITA